MMSSSVAEQPNGKGRQTKTEIADKYKANAAQDRITALKSRRSV